MHTLYCIVGRTAVGKSTITRMVAEKLGMAVLQSFTTRPKREAELKHDPTKLDHIFVSKEDAKVYQNKMVAYTEINGYEYWCNLSQLYTSDFYVIDPNGIRYLKKYIEDNEIDNLRLVVINIKMPYVTSISNATKRGQSIQEFQQRYDSETTQFDEFEKDGYVDYKVLNDSTLHRAVEKLTKIIMEDSGLCVENLSAT